MRESEAAILASARRVAESRRLLAASAECVASAREAVERSRLLLARPSEGD